MHAIMPDQVPPAEPPRGLHQICEDVRRAECGACPALPGEECIYTTAPVSVPVTPRTPVRPVRGYHVNRFAIAEASNLISITDMAAVLEAAGAFTTTTVIYDGEQEDTMSAHVPADTFRCCTTPIPWPTAQHDQTCPDCGTIWEREPVSLGAGARIKSSAWMRSSAPGREGLTGPVDPEDDDLTGTLGPFETSGDALLSVRPDDGSFTGREALWDLLKKTMHATDVTLGGWDWCVLRWLADQDVQTVAAIAGWVGRGNGGLTDPDAGAEPYCAECGQWIGMFFGMEGWHHFRGDPAPGGQRQLYDAGHEASPAWCEPPGRAISPADAVTVRQALADAEAYRRERVEAYCYDCAKHPAGACEDHLNDLDQAGAYAELGRQLRQEEDR